jgi:hypothetical protein
MEPTFFSPSEMDGIVLQDIQIASYAVPGLLVALVAERNVVFALARMWEAFIEGIGWETKIFSGAGGSTRLGSNSCERQVQVGSSLSHCFNFLFRSRLCV